MLAVARKHRKALRSLVSALYLVWPGYRTFDPQPEQTHGGHFQAGLLLTSFVSCPDALPFLISRTSAMTWSLHWTTLKALSAQRSRFLLFTTHLASLPVLRQSILDFQVSEP